jgi:hypothetical protein
MTSPGAKKGLPGLGPKRCRECRTALDAAPEPRTKREKEVRRKGYCSVDCWEKEEG